MLTLLDQQHSGGPNGSEAKKERKAPPKYLRVVVEENGESGSERLNILIPMTPIRSCFKLAALIPNEAANRVNKKLEQ